MQENVGLLANTRARMEAAADKYPLHLRKALRVTYTIVADAVGLQLRTLVSENGGCGPSRPWSLQCLLATAAFEISLGSYQQRDPVS